MQFFPHLFHPHKICLNWVRLLDQYYPGSVHWLETMPIRRGKNGKTLLTSLAAFMDPHGTLLLLAQLWGVCQGHVPPGTEFGMQQMPQPLLSAPALHYFIQIHKPPYQNPAGGQSAPWCWRYAAFWLLHWWLCSSCKQRGCYTEGPLFVLVYLLVCRHNWGGDRITKRWYLLVTKCVEWLSGDFYLGFPGSGSCWLTLMLLKKI